MSDGKQAPRITIIGIGNTLMGDDGLGVAIVQDLLPRIPDDKVNSVNVVIGGVAGMGLLKHFRESDVVIVVDAIDTQAAPGAIFRFTPDEAGLVHLRSNNIHGMGVPHLVANSRLVGANPEIIVYAIQVGDVRPRDNILTTPVTKASERVKELILEELMERLTVELASE